MSNQDTHVPRKALLAGIALLCGATQIARLGTELVKAVVPYDIWLNETGGMERVETFLRHLPEVASHDRPTALVFGSSIVQFGFSPAAFDARLAERGIHVDSYNLGLGGNNPSIQRLIADRVAAAFQRAGRKASLVIVEFTPFQATRARLSGELGVIALAKRSQLVDLPERFRTTLRSPADGCSLLALAALGGYSPSATTTVLEHWMLDPPDPSWWPGPAQEAPAQSVDDALEARIHELTRKTLGDEPSAWTPQWRGEFRMVFPDTLALYAEYVAMRTTRARMERDRRQRIASSDVVELHFDEQLVEDEIAVIRSLQTIAQRSFLVIAPSNRAWIRPTPAALARLQGVVDRLQRETGVPLLDLSMSEAFVAEDFIDTTHLNEHRGRPKLSRMLAEAVADAIARDAARRASDGTR